jgi:hypothetical protein
MSHTSADYRASMHSCLAKAELTNIEEIRALWRTVANSYRFLMKREERLWPRTANAC